MLQEMEQRIRKLESWMHDSAYDTRHQIRSELYQRNRLDIQMTGLKHLFSALCVNTIDPMAEGQVQFFTPALTNPGVSIGGLPWAYPISPFGGFDDSGVSWVPPAGSKLALLCDGGDVNQAYYIGTVWSGTRGVSSRGGQNQSPEEGQSQMPNQDNNRLDLWGYQIPEYDCIFEGTRDGYNLGSNDGDQVKMPWNTDNYQVKDWDTQDDFDLSPEANKFITYPHIYGFKTPGKHYSKYQDGDHKCNEKWSRVEHATGRGNIFMMKDDHLHPAAQWAFNGGSSNDLSQCHSPIEDFTDCSTPDEDSTCEDEQSNSSIQKDEFANAFFKRQEEMRFYKAPDSLAQFGNPKCELPQSGIQIQSISGNQLVMDDSVDQPQGIPNWKLDFDFGCNDIFKGKYFLRSTTGHFIGMNDDEDDTLIRSENNGIKILTASGNKIELNDHTIGDKEDPQNAGEKRGIVIQSTAKHILEFHDEGNEQHSLPRQQPAIDPETNKQQDITQAKSDKAFVLLRSGYGLQLRMEDANSQTETQQQYLQLLAPQKDNKERGPHELVFQETSEGPGLVFLRSGGVYQRSSYDDAMEVVGDEKNPKPANKTVQVTGKYIVNVKDAYFNHNDLTIFQAEKFIILFAGRDCPLPPNAQEAAQQASESAQNNAQIAAMSQQQGIPNQLPLNRGPCLVPVLTGSEPWVCPYTGFIHFGLMSNPANPAELLHNSLSDRVFVSTSQENKNV